MADSYNKKEREKKKIQRKKEKESRKNLRKENSTDGSLESMMAYVDENGVIRDTPPDPTKAHKEIKAQNIEIGVPRREESDEDPVLRGSINFFDGAKGYGFIKAEDGESIFVHHSNITGVAEQGKKVRYEKEKGPKGWMAVRVVVE